MGTKLTEKQYLLTGWFLGFNARFLTIVLIYTGGLKFLRVATSIYPHLVPLSYLLRHTNATFLGAATSGNPVFANN